MILREVGDMNKHSNELSSACETAVLKLTGVSVVYDSGTVALRETSLAFEDHAFTVLLGPSGAGKSTLLRSLNLLVRPSTGTISSRVHGVLDGAATIRAHRKNCAMIFQQHQLIGRLSALRNVLTGRLGHHSAWRTLMPSEETERRLALACLERVGLLDKALSRCDALSGGQQQRVGIARALAQEPGIILADEPVASLDPAASERVLNKLREICKEDGTPVIVSLHQLEYARTYADRIIGLAAGRIVFDGPPADMTQSVLDQIYHS